MFWNDRTYKSSISGLPFSKNIYIYYLYVKNMHKIAMSAKGGGRVNALADASVNYTY